VPSSLRRLAWLLDSSIRLPGGFRIGLDGIIGLVPGVGDLVAGVLSFYIVFAGVRLGMPVSVIARMILNVLLELVVGAVPVLGDLFDFIFKANERNIRLIEANMESPAVTRTSSYGIGWVILVMIIGLFMAIVIGVL